MSNAPEIPPIIPPKPNASPSHEITPDARNMAMLAHLLGALFGFIGPLIIWLVKKNESTFVDDQGKEALNFQLTLLIAYFITSILWTIIMFVTCGFGVLLPLPLLVTVFQLVFGIIGATRANAGEYYRYPMTIRMIS